MATHTYDLQSSAAVSTASKPQSVSRNSLADDLLELETMLFDPAVRHDSSTVADLLTEDFREFGSSGRVYTKPDILAELSTEESATITLTDYNCALVSPTVALLTYRSLATHERRGASQALRSSLWVLRMPDARSGQAPRWQMQFHQGTRF